MSLVCADMRGTRREILNAAAVTGLSIAPFGVLAGCLSGSSTDASTGGEIVETNDVTMRNNQFVPRNISITAGTTVTWTNEDGGDHTISAASENWTKDEEVASNQQATHTFDSAGVYEGYCRFHGSADLSGMSMKIGVGGVTIEDPLGSDSGGDY